MFVCLYVCMFECLYVCMFVCLYVCMCVRFVFCTFVCVHVCMCASPRMVTVLCITFDCYQVLKDFGYTWDTPIISMYPDLKFPEENITQQVLINILI